LEDYWQLLLRRRSCGSGSRRGWVCTKRHRSEHWSHPQSIVSLGGRPQICAWWGSTATAAIGISGIDYGKVLHGMVASKAVLSHSTEPAEATPQTAVGWVVAAAAEATDRSDKLAEAGAGQRLGVTQRIEVLGAV
jgi:hypothetical protein